MSFNEDKCKVMIFDKRKHNQMNTAFIEDVDSFSGFTMTDQLDTVQDLKETEVERDLGIMINNKLRWSEQIGHAKSKAYAILGTLKLAFVSWNNYSFRILYTTYVRPHLEYCSSAWNPCTETDIDSLKSVQKIANKLVPQLRSLHYEQRLAALGLTTLEDR